MAIMSHLECDIEGSLACKCETNLQEVMACKSLASAKLAFDTWFKVNLGLHVKKALISLIIGSRASKCEKKLGHGHLVVRVAGVLARRGWLYFELTGIPHESY